MKNSDPFTIYGKNAGKPETCLFLSVPHAGRFIPDGFAETLALPPDKLRLAEDAYTDELFWGETLGVPMLKANYARTFIDVNREPFELDQKMFSDPLPPYVNHFSIRAVKGFGTIPKIVKRGMKIYKGKLTFDEVKQRITNVYRPYHDQLAKMVKNNISRFDRAFIIDCHSMPSTKFSQSIDIVLGDNHGVSADKNIVDMVYDTLTAMGFKVAVNFPYAGGYTTCHYGCPELGVDALQVEVNRALYMNEATLEKFPDFEKVQQNLHNLIKNVKSWLK